LPTHRNAGDRVVRTLSVRSAEELMKVAGPSARITVPKALKVASIDFKIHMLLVVEDGTQPMVGVSGGGAPSALYAVAITRIERDVTPERMTVLWRLVPRAKGQGILTRPLEAVLVERFNGEVSFKRLPPADQAGKSDPEPAGKEAPAVGRAFWADGWMPEAPRQEWVVRAYAELIDPRLRAPEPVLEQMRREAAQRYAKALGVADIDFTKQMVVGVSAGVQPAGARVEVVRIERDVAGKSITVHWRLRAPAAGQPAGEIVHAAAVALFERIPGDIRFHEDEAPQ
jgi:hypothetical protein